MISESTKKIAGGALLVAGTATGAGMLALPVVTAEGGFFPACLIYILCYLFSCATGLLFLEICTWMPRNANLVSMSYHILGPVGRAVSWVFYIFLFYSLTIAYIVGGGYFVTQVFSGLLPQALGAVLFTIVFGACVYIGTKVVDRVNFILMIGLILTFVVFLGLGFPHVNVANLLTGKSIPAILALPVMFTSFSYQGIIPSLYAYLDQDYNKVRKAILIGATIPFVCYVLWELVVLGVIPLEGEGGLLRAKKEGWTAVEPFRFLLSKSWLSTVGQMFAFCALTTSFLGVTLGLLDFLSDSLQIAKKGFKKLFLCALIYIVPLIVAISNPGIFLRALGYAGGIGCVILLGFMPTLMVWKGRYKKHYTVMKNQLFGGKIVLSLLMVFIAFELCVEIIQEVQKILH